MDIEKSVATFYSDYNQKLDFTNLKDFIEKKTGFSVYFTDTNIGIRELARLGIKFPKNEKAITVTSGGTKIIFLRSVLSGDDKIATLLHESAHIALGHLDVPSAELDRQFSEYEAGVFASVARGFIERKYFKKNFRPIAVISVIILLIICCYSPIGNRFKNVQKSDMTSQSTVSQYSSGEMIITKSVNANSRDDLTGESQHTDDYGNELHLYVMPTGIRYHFYHCRYVNENAVAVTYDEAISSGYTPCLICCPPY